jgi:hypothetical protein|nr:MAG TPA: hypothetical protein [Caudoviricetes sp.]
MKFKTDWRLDDTVQPNDVNRWENNTKEVYEDLQDAQTNIARTAAVGANNTHDISMLAFQLELKALTDSEQLTNVCIDTITSADSVKITSGSYTTGKVYI